MSVAGASSHQLLSQLLYFDAILDAILHIMTEMASHECDEDYTAELVLAIVDGCGDLNSQLSGRHFQHRYRFYNPKTGRKATITIDIETGDIKNPREEGVWE